VLGRRKDYRRIAAAGSEVPTVKHFITDALIVFAVVAVVVLVWLAIHGIPPGTAD
jgi:hypothetical protein